MSEFTPRRHILAQLCLLPALWACGSTSQGSDQAGESTGAGGSANGATPTTASASGGDQGTSAAGSNGSTDSAASATNNSSGGMSASSTVAGSTAGGSVGGNSGSAGADGSSTGGSDTAGAGGTGGSSGVDPVALECREGALDEGALTGDSSSPEEKRSYTGENGAFVDHCMDGNLVEYHCDYRHEQVDPEYPDTFPVQTGLVLDSEVDCGGRCQDGTCPDPCPEEDQVMRYASITDDGTHVIENLATGWRYECSSVSSYGTSFDCDSELEVGTELIVTGSISRGCTGSIPLLYLGLDGATLCSYQGCIVLGD